ncbi:MAG TPA: hypothetical protein VJ892_01550 [Candidatus Absconditabacterales bacterium]|nr:hypothetical protein [Candidatus Absconditabacterales bacterium]
MKKLFTIFFVTLFIFSCGKSHLKENEENDFKNYLSSVQDTNLFVTDYEDCLVVVYHTDDTVYCVCLSDDNSYIQSSPKNYFEKTLYREVSIDEAKDFLREVVE